MSILLILGIVVMLVGGIMFLIVAFKENLLWGFGCLLLSPVSIAFLVMHWDDSKKPFFIQLAGLGLVLAGGGFSAQG